MARSGLQGQVALVVKNPPAEDVRDLDLPGVRKIPWRRAWQHALVFFLESPIDRGAWRAIVHGAAKSHNMTEHNSSAKWELGAEEAEEDLHFQSIFYLRLSKH